MSLTWLAMRLSSHPTHTIKKAMKRGCFGTTVSEMARFYDVIKTL